MDIKDSGSPCEPTRTKEYISFSIESILSKNGPKGDATGKRCTETKHDATSAQVRSGQLGEVSQCRDADSTVVLPWLAYTRYSPPKLPRGKRRKCTKRKSSGNPRVPFTTSQLMTLERKYIETRYLSGPEVSELSSRLTLSEHRVKIWFQNRRAREKKSQHSWSANDDRIAFGSQVVLDHGRCIFPGWFGPL